LLLENYRNFSQKIFHRGQLARAYINAIFSRLVENRLLCSRIYPFPGYDRLRPRVAPKPYVQLVLQPFPLVGGMKPIKAERLIDPQWDQKPAFYPLGPFHYTVYPILDQ